MIFRSQSFKQAAFWATAIGALSQGLALISGVVMATVFGAQESTDVLYYCLGIFVLFASLIQQINVAVLVPETMRRREQTGELDAMAFINRFLAGFAFVFAVIAGVLWFNSTEILTTISQFPVELLEKHRGLVMWLVISFPLQMAAQLLLDILVSYRFLLMPACLAVVGRVINIVFVLTFYRHWGVVAAAMGMTIGYAIQILVNIVLLHRVIHWRFDAWKTKIGSTVCKNLLWAELGALVASTAIFLPLYLFTGFSAGVLTALNYAQRLCNVPVQVLTEQFSSVAAVKFNELKARSHDMELDDSFVRLSRIVVFILMPISVLLALVGHDIASVLFGYGKFQGAALQQTSLLFSVLVLNLTMTGFMTIQSRYVIARQAIRYGVLCQMFSTCLNLVIVFIAVVAWGPVGYPIGVCIHLVLYMGIVSVSMKYRFAGLTLWSVWKTFVRMVMVCGISALPVLLFRQWAASLLPPIGLGGTSVAIYLAICGVWLWGWSPDPMALDYCKKMGEVVLSKAKT